MPHQARTLPQQAVAERDMKSEADAIMASVIEDAEVLHASLKAGSIAQIIIAVTAVVALLYFLRYVLIISLIALLAAFVLEPLVGNLARLRVPRAAGALFAVLTASVIAGALSYLLLIQINPISRALPHYSERIRRSIGWIQEPVSRLERSARTMTNAPGDGSDEAPILVQETTPTSHLLVSNFGTIGNSCWRLAFCLASPTSC